MYLGELLSGVVGAVLGALLGAKVAVVVAARQIRASQLLQHRDELRQLVAAFWAACDAVWEAKVDLAHVITEVQIERQSGGSALMETLEERRQQAFATIRAGEKDIRQSIALMRLLFPELEDRAQRLALASRRFKMRPDAGDFGTEFVAARSEALVHFERKVRSILEVGRP